MRKVVKELDYSRFRTLKIDERLQTNISQLCAKITNKKTTRSTLVLKFVVAAVGLLGVEVRLVDVDAFLNLPVSRTIRIT